MRKLNKHYTTMEQSQKLLRLGVPANSADCYYVDDDETPKFRETDLFFSPKGKVNDGYSEYEVTYTPCWSVGRLIEIYLTCTLDYHPYDDFYTETPTIHFMAFDKNRLINEIIELFEEDEMDFSKLEE